MTISEKIKRFVETHNEINESLLPRIGIYWETKDVRHIFLNDKSKSFLIDANPLRAWRIANEMKATYNVDLFSTPRTIYASYIDYDKELDICEMSIVFMKARRFKNGERGKWERFESVDRTFFTGKNNIPYDINGEILTTVRSYKETVPSQEYLTSIIAKYMYGIYFCEGHRGYRQLKKFTEFVGPTIYKRNGTSYPSGEIYGFYNWATTKQGRPKPTKTQKIINTVTDFKLSEVTKSDIESFDYKLQVCKPDWWLAYACAKFEKISDDWSCIRAFTKTFNGWEENLRLYISAKKFIVTSKNQNGEWVNATTLGRYTHIYIVNYDDISACERFKYIKSLLDEVAGNKRIHAIINVIRHPILEKLIKANCPFITSKIITSPTPLADIKNNFGEIKENKASLYAALGINREQLEFVKTHDDYPKNILKLIKHFSKTESIASMDSNSFHEAADVFRWAFKTYTFTPSPSYILNSCPTEIEDHYKFLKNMYKISGNGKSDMTLHTVRDIMNANRSIAWRNPEQVVRINWMDIDSLDTLNAIHDNVIALKNELERQYRIAHPNAYYGYGSSAYATNEKNTKKYEETLEDRKFLEESDDEYAIILPKKLTDLIDEGNYLGHCVGGYVERHAKGETTILFLRQKSNIDTPWITIEYNHGTIVQMHGMHNCWMGYKDETFKAVPFVMNWLKKNNIKCNKNILMNKSSRYSSVGECRSEAELAKLVSKVG